MCKEFLKAICVEYNNYINLPSKHSAQSKEKSFLKLLNIVYLLQYVRTCSMYLLLYAIGESLLTGNGPKWFRTRHLLTPAFHFDILKPYVKVYCECVDVLLVSTHTVHTFTLLIICSSFHFCGKICLHAEIFALSRSIMNK